MPLSMVEELLFVLKEMKELRCEAKALEQMETVGEGNLETGRERAHIRLLHALVVKAVGVAGHRRHGNSKILAALMAVLKP